MLCGAFGGFPRLFLPTVTCWLSGPHSIFTETSQLMHTYGVQVRARLPSPARYPPAGEAGSVERQTSNEASQPDETTRTHTGDWKGRTWLHGRLGWLQRAEKGRRGRRTKTTSLVTGRHLLPILAYNLPAYLEPAYIHTMCCSRLLCRLLRQSPS